MKNPIPLHEREIRVIIERMFLGFPVSQRGKEARAEVYVEALSRIPLKHVREASNYAARGRIGEGHYLPTVGEMVLLAEDFHAREIRANLPPQTGVPYIQNSKEQRLSIIQGFRQLLLDLKSGKPIEPKTATERVFRVSKEEL